MCEWGKVAAGAQRAVLGHDRHDACVDKAHQRLCHLRSRSRGSEGERACTQEHHGPHHLGFDRRAHPGGVGADQRLLQGDPPIGGNRGVGQGAEAGGDPVGRLALGQRFDDAAGGGHARQCCIAESDLFTAAGHRDDIGNGDARAIQFHG